MSNQIHWFPGHMKKAVNEMANKVKMVDVIIELFDARAPLASINDDFEKIVGAKKRLIILTKPDLADESITKYWVNKLKERFDQVLALDLTNPNSQKTISNAVFELGKEKQMKDISRGMKPQPIRAMIIGIPNVGKSSLINRIAKRNAAGVQNKPGFTRGEQWIKVNKDFLLLDTPGVLPTSYEDKTKATKLAILGAIREDILPNEVLINHLLPYLKKHYPNALKDRFGIENLDLNILEILQAIATRRGFIRGLELDIDKAESCLLKEFKDGKLGRISLEREDA